MRDSLISLRCAEEGEGRVGEVENGERQGRYSIEEGERIENENFIGADEHADSIQNVMIQNGKGVSTQSSVHDTIYSIRNVMIL